MIRLIVVALTLLWPMLAQANHIHDFLGWSPDGTAYGYVDLHDDDANEDVLICRTDPAVPSPTWPAGIKQGKDCTGLDCDDMGFCKGIVKRKKLLSKYLVDQKPAKKGPQGQTVKLRKSANKLHIEVAGRSFELQMDDYEVRADSELGAVYWRADGGAVAFTIDTTGAGNFVYVRSLTGTVDPATANTGRDAAKAANVRGMRLHKANDWAGAAKEFRASIAADADWVTPRYNLACALGRQRDAAGAREQLEWLAKSSDPDARKRLEKGKTDEDLVLVRDDAKIRALLGVSAETSAAPVGAAVTAVAQAARGASAAGTAKTRAINLSLLAWTDKPISSAEGEDNDCQTPRSFKLAAPQLTVTGSYEDHIAIVDGKGKKLAGYDGDSCLLGIGLVQLVPDEDPEIVVQRRVQVGRGAYQEEFVILKRFADKLVDVFIGIIADEAEAKWVRAPNIGINADGTIRYRDPDKKNAKDQLLRWNPTKRKFLP